MALRLRRGTNLERLSVIPAEGELVYTTDTKQLFVGDGTTSGGNAVAVGAGISINDLLDVNTSQGDSTQPVNGEGLIWDANNSEWRPGTVSGGGSVASLNDIGDVVITGVNPGEVLTWDGLTWINDTPSIGSISLNDLTDVSEPSPNSGEALVYNGANWVGTSVLQNLSDDTTPTLGGTLNASNFSITNVNNLTANSISSDGIISAEEFNGRLQGNIINNASTVVYNSATNNLTINDIDANRIDASLFEATTSITAPLFLDTSRQIRVGNAQFPHSLIITNDSGGADDYIRIFSDTNTSNKSWGMEFNISRTSVDTPTTLGAFDLLSGISWRGHDGTAYRPAASIYTYTLAGPVNNVIPTGMLFSTNDSSGTEQVLIFSEGALTVPGTVTAPNFVGDITGSLFTDASTQLIDATDGKLLLGNVNVVGETGNIPLDTGTVDSWLEVQVNGATKYIPLYD